MIVRRIALSLVAAFALSVPAARAAETAAPPPSPAAPDVSSLPLPALPAGAPSSLPGAAFAAPPFQAVSEKLEFSEVWAYLISGEERFFDPAQPITDLAYFGADIDMAGKLADLPKRAKLSQFKGRVHLVVNELSNYALAHFCLSPEYPLRDALVADILDSAKDYDGVQIDFEALSSRDYENFYAFLALLKGGLGQKALSVAMPAYLKEPKDGLSYDRVAKIADRIVVMAYDEHWSSSEPGPVASMDWCRKVAGYAVSAIGADKLVMGLPFYGRAWADKSLSRAYKYSSLAKLIDEKGIGIIQRKDEIPYIEYDELVSVKVYFDDSASTLRRLGMYGSASVRNVAFWRLGQEDPAVWGGISIPAASAPASAAPAAADCSLPPVPRN